MLTKLNVDYKYYLQTWDSSTLDRITSQQIGPLSSLQTSGSASPRARSDTILQQKIIELEQTVKARDDELEVTKNTIALNQQQMHAQTLKIHSLEQQNQFLQARMDEYMAQQAKAKVDLDDERLRAK